MIEKPNIHLTVYITDSMMGELEKQAIKHSGGVKSDHARVCIQIGMDHFRHVETQQNLFDLVNDANETYFEGAD
jgi:hypothetical protein